jgi:hypothetical protein
MLLILKRDLLLCRKIIKFKFYSFCQVRFRVFTLKSYISMSDVNDKRSKKNDKSAPNLKFNTLIIIYVTSDFILTCKVQTVVKLEFAVL